MYFTEAKDTRIVFHGNYSNDSIEYFKPFIRENPASVKKLNCQLLPRSFLCLLTLICNIPNYY